MSVGWVATVPVRTTELTSRRAFKVCLLERISPGDTLSMPACRGQHQPPALVERMKPCLRSEVVGAPGVGTLGPAALELRWRIGCVRVVQVRLHAPMADEGCD